MRCYRSRNILERRADAILGNFPEDILMRGILRQAASRLDLRACRLLRSMPSGERDQMRWCSLHGENYAPSI